MKALGYAQNGPIDAPESIIEIEASTPEVGARDLLVEVRGVSVNPVDTKVRSLMPAQNGPRVLGFDASGIVRKAGPKVTLFKEGDEVYYAGDITRPGTHAAMHTVDERIVGRKPRTLNFADAAGLPLTSITAWELLFDTLSLKEGDGAKDSMLIIGGAGGVGSILIQLVKQLTQLTVIASASRPETTKWVEQMGADAVINHKHPLAPQVKALKLEPKYVASLNHTDTHFSDIIELIQARGELAVIDDPQALDIKLMKRKSLSFRWEYMFARPVHQTADMQKQHSLLNRVSELIDSGILRSTVTQNLGQLSVATLKQAHALQESNTVIGKNVLGGFSI